MAEDTTPLVVRFDALGRETNNIEEWFIDSDYLKSTDEFSFTYIDDIRENLRGLECQPVTLSVGGIAQLVGRVDTTQRGDRAFAVACKGRDYFADMVECEADPKISITENMTLQAALEHMLSPLGMNLILGDSSVTRNARSGVRPRQRSAPKDFRPLTLKELKPEPETGLYEYATRLVARHGATLQPTLARNEALVEAPHYDQDPIGSLVRSLEPGNTKNNIKTGEALRDFARFPTVAIVRGLTGDIADSEASPENASQIIEAAGITPETAAVSVKGRVKPTARGEDATGKLYRLLSLHDKLARTATQLRAAAFRAIWDRLKDTLLYTCTVKGHRDPETGALWTVGTIVNVQDEKADVNEPMWMHQRKFRFKPGTGPDAGAETDMTFWRRGALQLGASA